MVPKSSASVGTCSFARGTTDVLATIVLAVNHHDATTPACLVPSATTPAAVPQSTFCFEGTLSKRTAGLGVARWSWMCDPFRAGLPARSALGLGALAAVTCDGADMLTYELVSNRVAHDACRLTCQWTLG